MAEEKGAPAAPLDKAGAADKAAPTGPFVSYTLAGWTFLAVLLAFLADAPNKTPWQNLVMAARDSSLNNVFTLVFGAVVGLTAPPALGFVLYRGGGFFEEVLRSVRKPKEAIHHTAGGPIKSELGKAFGEIDESDRSLTRMLFRAAAPPSLLASRDKHETNVHAAASSAAAIVAAWLTGAYISWSVSVAVICLTSILGYGLLGAARSASRRRHEERAAWASTYGLLEARGLAKRWIEGNSDALHRT